MDVAYSHRHCLGTDDDSAIHDFGSAIRTVAEMRTGSLRIRLDMACFFGSIHPSKATVVASLGL
jgi:hypothetical protein